MTPNARLPVAVSLGRRLVLEAGGIALALDLIAADRVRVTIHCCRLLGALALEKKPRHTLLAAGALGAVLGAMEKHSDVFALNLAGCAALTRFIENPELLRDQGLAKRFIAVSRAACDVKARPPLPACAALSTPRHAFKPSLPGCVPSLQAGAVIAPPPPPLDHAPTLDENGQPLRPVPKRRLSMSDLHPQQAPPRHADDAHLDLTARRWRVRACRASPINSASPALRIAAQRVCSSCPRPWPASDARRDGPSAGHCTGGAPRPRALPPSAPDPR